MVVLFAGTDTPSELALRRVTQQQGCSRAALDSCFTGDMVCGRERLQGLRRADGVRLIPRTASATMYNFGSGSSCAEETYEVQSATSSTTTSAVVLDVVNGALPLLVGQKRLGDNFISMTFSPEGTAVERNSLPVKSVRLEKLPNVDVESLLIGTFAGDTNVSGPGDGGAELGLAGAVKSGGAAAADGGPVAGGAQVATPTSCRDVVDRVHGLGHSGADRMFAFIKASSDQRAWTDAELLQACKQCVFECVSCGKFGKKPSMGTVLRVARDKNSRGWLDLFTLNHSQQWHCLVVVDEGTRDCAGWFVQGTGTDAVFNAYLMCWASVHGCHKLICSDGDGCFSSEAFKDLCLSYGILKEAGPAESSASFGLVERQIQVFRTGTDRLSVDPSGPRNATEWSLAIALLGNAIRNEVIVDGHSASERSIGARSSVLNNFLTELRAAPVPDVAHRLAQIKESTSRGFHAAISDRVLRAKLREKPQKKDAHAVFKLGDWVEYFREPLTGRGARWNVGKIAGVVLDEFGDILYYHIDRAGTNLRVAANQVRCHFDVAPPDDVLRARGELAGVDVGDVGDETKLPSWKFAPDQDVGDVGNEQPSSYDRQGGAASKGDAQGLADKQTFERQNFFDKATHMNLMVYDVGFSQLPEDEQEASRRRAIDDYDSGKCWDRETDCDDAQVANHLQRTKTAVKCSGVWVPDLVKYKDGMLIGKSRWAPRGYEDAFRFSEDNQAPTVKAVCVRCIDSLGMRAGWTSFDIDWSKAFFQIGELLTRDIFIQVPPEDHSVDQTKAIGDGATKNYWRRLTKLVPGTNGAPRAWYMTISKWLLDIGFQKSKIDPCVFYYPQSLLKWSKSGGVASDTPWCGVLPLHVDDGRGRGTAPFIEWFKDAVYKRWMVGEFNLNYEGCVSKFTGAEYKETAEGLYSGQDQYVTSSKLEEMVDSADDVERLAGFQSLRGAALWATVHSQVLCAYDISLAAQRTEPTTEDVSALNATVRRMKSDPLTIFSPRLSSDFPVKVVGILDAGQSDRGTWEGGHAGQLVGLAEDRPEPADGFAFDIATWKSGRIRRVARDSFDGECLAGHECLSQCVVVQMLVREFFDGLRKSLSERTEDEISGYTEQRYSAIIELYTDSNSLVTNVNSSFNRANMSGRRAEDVADFRQTIAEGALRALYHINGTSNPTDALTKGFARTHKSRETLKELLVTGFYKPDLSEQHQNNQKPGIPGKGKRKGKKKK